MSNLRTGFLLLAVLSTGCTASARYVAPMSPLATEGMSPLAGQQATCAGPRHKTFSLEAKETTVDLGMGMRFNAWTYNGRLPAPTLEACEGDEVTIELANHAGTSHGLDSHALRIDTSHFGPVPPQDSMTIDRTVDTPGVYMYHCASGPVTDFHIKSGLSGAMIVYPRGEMLPPARDIVVVESGIYGEPDNSGLIPGTDSTRAQKNDPAFVMFNGRFEHAPLQVAPGEPIRAFFVNVGPGMSSVHVMGTILDRVTDGSRRIDAVQTYGVPAGSGAMIEFRIPEKGTFGLVDHDKLSYVPLGLMIDFQAGPTGPHGTM